MMSYPLQSNIEFVDILTERDDYDGRVARFLDAQLSLYENRAEQADRFRWLLFGASLNNGGLNPERREHVGLSLGKDFIREHPDLFRYVLIQLENLGLTDEFSQLSQECVSTLAGTSNGPLSVMEPYVEDWTG